MSIGHALPGLFLSGPRHGYDRERAFDEKSDHDRPPHGGRVRSPGHGGDVTDRVVHDHPPLPPKAGPRRPEPAAARPDNLDETVTR